MLQQSRAHAHRTSDTTERRLWPPDPGWAAPSGQQISPQKTVVITRSAHAQYVRIYEKHSVARLPTMLTGFPEDGR